MGLTTADSAPSGEREFERGGSQLARVCIMGNQVLGMGHTARRACSFDRRWAAAR